jgi:hypothetical protein
LEID